MRSWGKASLAVCLLAALPAPGRADKAAEVILDQAIQAAGGAAKLAKYQGFTWKGKGTFYGMGEGIPFTSAWAVQLPDKERTVLEFAVNGIKYNMVVVINGNKGWFQLNDRTSPLGKDQLKESAEVTYAGAVSHLIILKNHGFTLSALGEVKLDGQTAAGIKVSRKGHQDVKLFFDKKTHLLVQSETTVKDQGKEMKQETFYRHYQAFQGVQLPTKVTIKRDGKRYLESQASDYQLKEKLDDSLFRKP